MDLSHLTDCDLLRRFAKERSEGCFEELVRRHGVLVLNACRRVLGHTQDAEDASQAVFLTLAHKAADVARNPSAAGWLHHVAHCVALNALQARFIRVRHEREAATMNAGSQQDKVWQELELLLDTELDALPEKYRLPILLCHLEGRSLAEASALLNCKQGTLESWLTRGREALRERLARRGLVLSVAVLGAMLSRQASAGELPALFAAATVKSASLAAVGNMAAGGSLVSSQTILLTKGALNMLFWIRMKSLAAALLLMVGLAAAGGTAWYAQAQDGPQPVSPDTPAPGEKPAPAELKPAVKDGLAIIVAPVKSSFGEKEPLAFQVSLKNVSRKAFLLFDSAHFQSTYSPYVMTVEDLQSKERLVLRCGIRDERVLAASDSKKLKPGDTLNEEIRVDEHFFIVERKGGLKSGKYRLILAAKFSMNNLRDARWALPHWEGEIEANPVEFEIAKEAGPVTEPAAPPTAGERKALVESNNAFALDLYERIKTKKGNLFFSPYSISSGLAMAYAGARGNTAAEMAKALRFTLAQDRVHPSMGALIADLNAPTKDGKPRGFQLSVANSLWGQKGYPFKQDFLNLTKESYGAGLTEVDFQKAAEDARVTINTWVEQKTKDKIKDLIAKDGLANNNRLVLVNAIYFKSDWHSPFQKDQTKDEPFNFADGKQATVPMMHQTGHFRYMEEENKFQALEMPYYGLELSMLVFLPSAPDGLAGFENTVTPEKMAKWTANLKMEVVSVILPKFKMTWGTVDLLPELQSMGMKDAFDFRAANFSGMADTNNLYIGMALHKAFVDVNEEGTEAAAASGFGVRSGGGRARDLKVFKADRPFLFAIRDNASGNLLFMGRVADPKEASPVPGAAGAANATEAFLGTPEQWTGCTLQLRDVHGLHGGLDIDVQGTGDCIIRNVSLGHKKETKGTFKLTAEEGLALRKLCIDQNLLDVKPPNRAGVPDEGRPDLILLNSAGEKRTITKWSGDKIPAFDKIYEALVALRKKL